MFGLSSSILTGSLKGVLDEAVYYEIPELVKQIKKYAGIHKQVEGRADLTREKLLNILLNSSTTSTLRLRGLSLVSTRMSCL